MGEVQHTCSRIIVINRGKIVADGAVGQLMTKAVQGGSRVMVEIAGEGVIPALKVVRGVKRLEELPAREGHTVAALQVEGEDARPAIFKLAKERGWTLFELHQEARDLEDVFRQLTGTTTEA
jgi:ABC-2 type transport system ATP-binding protein